jgi:4-diphosphocytidyl-2-C-methyl-D-erythritol kinase
VLAQGKGERLSPAPVWPSLPAVLVNPGVASPTGSVYRAYDAAGRFSDLQLPVLPGLSEITDVARVLGSLRNDLEAPAVALAPAIGEALAVLRARPEPLLARMSGSGATCFALCADDADAARMAAALAHDHPGWWVQACRIG